MKGIAGYSKPNASGGVTVDTEAMMVDLITVFKAAGHSEQYLLGFVSRLWPEVKVQVSIPKSKKN